MLLGCGLRRSELVGLETDEVQTRQEHWAIVDLIGKGGHIRTVPIPQWAKQALGLWASAAEITHCWETLPVAVVRAPRSSLSTSSHACISIADWCLAKPESFFARSYLATFAQVDVIRRGC